MKQFSFYLNYIFINAIVFLLFIVPKHSKAQLIYQPYSYQFYQKLNTVVYSPETNLHTSIKPYIIPDSSSVRYVYDSLMMSSADNSAKSWLHRVLFSGHVADVKRKGYTFYLDYLPDVQIGREFNEKQTTSLNTRGFQFGATVGHNIFLFTSAYENQGKFPNYESAYISRTKMIPSQIPVNGIPFSAGTIDWTYVTSLIGYKPSKALTFTLGQDKLFIGEGYRSMLLSDFPPVYPQFRLTIDLGSKIQYMATWAYMEDQNAPQFNSFINNRRKWGVFHYIDWNITNRISLGFYNALITAEANDQGKLQGFDLNVLNPLFFSSGLGPQGSIPDHTLFGFNGKYKLLDKTTVYGQLLFDQALTSNNSLVSAWQIGLRGADLFTVKSLNYLFEFNTAVPYTYSAQFPIVNYTQLSESLADPFGANFREWLALFNYSIGRFDLQGQINYAEYGMNIGNINYGNDITLPSNVNAPSPIGHTGQGLATTLKYAEGTVAYVLNPKYNFRIEIGGLFRQEKNNVSDTKTVLLTLGLRSSFRNLYHDF